MSGVGPKEIVLAAGAELFGPRGVEAVDRWFSPGYIQHNPTVPDGPEGLKGAIAAMGDDVRFETHRVIEDGDHVALHVTYHGLGPWPMAAFDVFRVEDGLIAEHWDALQPLAERTVSGRTETDGPTEVTDLERTEENRALVTGFVERVLMGGGGEVTDFVSAERYDQHSPRLADGADALDEQLAARRYDTLHKVLAQGNFVLTLAEGALGPTRTAFYDLYRVADGKIVEHWDVTPPVPEVLAHDNGLF